MANNSDAYYGEMYLRDLHQLGYPTEKDRADFNHRFYTEKKSQISDQNAVVMAVYRFYRLIKVSSCLSLLISGLDEYHSLVGKTGSRLTRDVC